MDLAQALIFGIVQGLTEFLPVSSSGHLVLTQYYMGWGENLPGYVAFATNTGTLLAVMVYLRKDVVAALTGFFGGLVSAEGRRSEGWRMALLVLAGSVPTGIVGLAVRPVFESLNTPLLVCFALIVTGFILWFAPRGGSKDSPRDLSFADAIIAGLAQSVAIFPGLSRSGTTIAVLLWRGASAEMAPRLSFLMYLVVSVGVALVSLEEVLAAHLDWTSLLALVASSFVIGYLALIVLFGLLRRGRFRVFSPYLWVVALLTLVRLATAG